MKDKFFELFESKFGAGSQRVEVPAERFDKYRSILPERLLSYWNSEGWAAYKGGLFWTVDPDAYKPLIDMWLEGTEFETLDNYHVFARTAFGKLYVWGERNQRQLTILCPIGKIMAQIAKINKPNPDPEMSIASFFAVSLPKDHDIHDDYEQPLFVAASKSLGALRANEVYGFVQPLTLGGVPSIGNLAKLDMNAHLTMLHQLRRG